MSWFALLLTEHGRTVLALGGKYVLSRPRVLPAAVVFMIGVPALAEDSGNSSLNQALRAMPQQQGFTGKVESTLEPRLGRTAAEQPLSHLSAVDRIDCVAVRLPILLVIRSPFE